MSLSSILSIISARWDKYNFLFEELVKRDFKARYKRATLGILWSLLGPLLQLLVMALIFTHFFGRTTPHFIIYLFAGKLVFLCFKDATSAGMQSLMANAGIITKIKTPKYIFLLSKNVSALINFLLTLIIFFIFVAADGIAFHPRFIFLLYPILCLMLFNIGVGLFLSAIFVFFKDTQYLYDIFTMMVMWLSAIFYPIDRFSYQVQQLFMLNPIFTYIQYFRSVVIDGTVPSLTFHAICGFYALAAFVIGSWVYKRYNYRFVYYM